VSDAPSFSLRGKVVLQFGGSGLLGRALVVASPGQVRALVVASREPEVLAGETATATSAGRRIHHETVDLLDESSITALVVRVTKNHYPLDGMVYNAVSRTMSGMATHSRKGRSRCASTPPVSSPPFTPAVTPWPRKNPEASSTSPRRWAPST
jgi:NAD(P)-dependent dehydrogenase (short-subunit alcohol dehydrogenase family)